jgi:hypothetical protein
MRIVTGATLTLAMLISPIRPAAADWEYTKWGMSPEQVVKASAGTVLLTKARPAGDGSGLDMRAQGTFASGGMNFDASFGFDAAGRLAFVTYALGEARMNDALENWLIKKYGQPKKTRGEEADVETWTWSHPGMDIIELDIPDGEPAFVIQYPSGK